MCRSASGYRKFETWRVNADGTGRTRLPIPDGDLVLDCSRDGTWLATRTIGGEPAHRGRLTLVHPDGTGARYLTEGSANDDLFSIFKISPDGRSIAYVEIKTVGDVRHSRLFVVDIEGKHPREIPVKFDPGTSVGVCWSPDGSRLALNLLDGRTKEGSIELVDLDGSNLRKVPLPPGRWNLHVSDWERLTPGLRAQSLDQPPDLKTTRGRYQALLEEYKTAFKAYDQVRKNAKTAEERDRADREKYPQPRSYIGRFLAIAESAPAEAAAIDALIWIVQRGFDGPEYDRAIDLLVSQAGTGRVDRDALAGLTRCRRRWNGCSARSSRRTLTNTPGDSPACGWASISSISPNGFAASARTPNRPGVGRPCTSKKAPARRASPGSSRGTPTP